MATEVTSSEYRSKERERDYYNRQAENARTQIGSLEQQIDRLQKAYDRVHQDYLDFKTEANLINKAAEEKLEFKGQNRRYMDDFMGSMKWEAEEFKTKKLDTAQDRIYSELVKKKNELSNQRGILGRAESAARSIWGWLNTHFFNN